MFVDYGGISQGILGDGRILHGLKCLELDGVHGHLEDKPSGRTKARITAPTDMERKREAHNGPADGVLHRLRVVMLLLELLDLLQREEGPAPAGGLLRVRQAPVVEGL